MARVLFAFSNERIVALHGFIKKSRKAPASELELARHRKKQWEKASG